MVLGLPWRLNCCYGILWVSRLLPVPPRRKGTLCKQATLQWDYSPTEKNISLRTESPPKRFCIQKSWALLLKHHCLLPTLSSPLTVLECFLHISPTPPPQLLTGPVAGPAGMPYSIFAIPNCGPMLSPQDWVLRLQSWIHLPGSKYLWTHLGLLLIRHAYWTCSINLVDSIKEFNLYYCFASNCFVLLFDVSFQVLICLSAWSFSMLACL